MKGKKKGKVLLVGAEDEENLAIRYLGAQLQSNGHLVKIVPCSTHNDFSGVIKELRSFRPDWWQFQWPSSPWPPCSWN